MKRLALVAVLAMLAAGCTPEQEAKWQATVSAIQSGVKVATSAVRQTLDEVCQQQPLVISTAQTAISIARARGEGPRTQNAIRNINSGIGALVAACEGGTANVTLAQLATRAWNAYKAIRAAQLEVQDTNGT